MHAIAIDTETTLSSDDEPIPRLVSVAIASRYNVDLHHHTNPDLEHQLCLLWNSADRVVFANAPFDVFVLIQRFPSLEPVIVGAYEQDRVCDVLTREKMIDIAAGEHYLHGSYSLASVAGRRIGRVVEKEGTWREHYRVLEDVPIAGWPTAAKRYAEDDAVATIRTWFAQEPFSGLFRPAAEISRKHIALYSQTLRGIITDQEMVDLLDARLTGELRRRRDRILSAGLGRWEGRQQPRFVLNQTAARGLMLDALGPETPVTPKGNIQLDEAAIRRLPDDHPLRDFAVFKSTRAKWSEYVPLLRRPIIRCRYEECQDTARTGSSAPNGRTPVHRVPPGSWVGRNLQNPPRSGGYRECLRSRPGYVLVITDWGQAELVTNAQNQKDELGWSPLYAAMAEGRDPHREFAEVLLGGVSYDPENPKHKAARQVAKPWNFGKWGGMGDRKFQGVLAHDYGIEMPLAQIQEYTVEWRRVWAADEYFRWVERQPSRPKVLDDGRIIKLYTMQHRRSGFTKGGCTFTEACNFPFQHLAAMAAGTALWRLWRTRQEWPGDQVLHLHDENVSEVRREVAGKFLETQEQIMIDAFRQWCPDVPIKVESKIVERYTK